MTRHSLSRTDTMLFMGGITALSAVSVDIVLPMTGVVARAFGVDESRGALLVGVYFVAYGIGQLFWGLFSDAFGRRFSLLLSLSGFALASLACAFAPSYGFLLTARFVQGLMGGAPVIARAMVRDVASGTDAARMMTVLGAILTVAAMLAPVLGSGLLVLFSWRAVFIALTALALAFIAYAALILRHPAGTRRPERFTLSFLRVATRRLLSSPAFLTPAIAGSLTFGGYASVGATGAIIAETRYGVPPESFGALFAIAALINTSAALIAGQLLRHVSLRQVGTIAMILLTLGAALHIALAFGEPGLQVFWGAVCLYVLAFGMILPTSLAAAMEPASEYPGFAASLMGAMQMIAASGAALLASALFDGSHRAISITMAVFGLAAVLTVILGRGAMRRAL
ncbi:MFS transporter, DHA1 family, bicyclomycin/chloramphenicol resistance protein [Salinihabitans flavidus]|uniref:MFS transporter, DHA1 family, bicyclomycin/chloramphenicol resistance protein n=1 Tax=Salinihabitans flavidus TaxID=569882 RepID=A0A1H8TQ88_9RHOB|nr:MFS transporter [Salinihabitans flavidus]SEO92608.1 MFS transporter, DHA1 family, bicyclomycin/chloramphenicol resistance protein [Salinihabitans flavidus]